MGYLTLNEYSIKKLFFNEYKKKYNITQIKDIDNFISHDWMTNNNLVVKIDNGSKRRGKNGLIGLNKDILSIKEWILETNKKFEYNQQYIIEEQQNIIEEHYISIRPYNNDYNEIIYNTNGGINIGDIDDNKSCKKFLISINYSDEIIEHINCDKECIHCIDKELKDLFETMPIIKFIYKFYIKYHFVFLEINPLIKTYNNEYIPIDFAAKIDDCALYLFDDIIINMIQTHDKIIKNENEKYIEDLDKTTGSSLKFKVLNNQGNIWTLIAGGGASVVYTDAIINRGYKEQLGNYGEYSGDPSKDLTYKYTCTVFKEMLDDNNNINFNKINDKKILFIGGGIANFTDVSATFEGIIEAIDEYANQLNKYNTEIWVRRGGINYKIGLENIKNICTKNNIKCHIYGIEVPITEIINLALPNNSNKSNNENNDNNDTNNNNIIDDNNIIDSKMFNKILSNYKCYNFDHDSKIFIYGFQTKVIQRILDFDYICKKKEHSISCIIDLSKSKKISIPFFFGTKEILIPVYNNLHDAINDFKNTKNLISYCSFRSTYKEIGNIIEKCNQIKTITIIAEGIPELYSRKLINKANKYNKMLIGPATVGGIVGNTFRIGNTGGESIIDAKLYNRGSVGFVSRSGGMLNELCNIISKKTDGVYQGISIGGDRYTGLNFINLLLNYEKNPNISMMILLGEVGGIQEILVADAVKKGLITKPIIGWCIGTSSKQFDENIQFGHAGASATNKYEDAIYKNNYMKNSGKFVPNNFEEISGLIEDIFNNNTKDIYKQNIIKIEYNKLPYDYDKLKKDNLIRKQSTIFSSITDERKELHYNNTCITNIKYGIGEVIGHLWFKKIFDKKLCKYIELIMTVTADHGPCVSGSQNTIVCARAQKDLVSSICSGLLTIGPKFGGAINDALYYFYNNCKNNISPQEFINNMRKNNKNIPGIGHKIKTKTNIDSRIKLLENYVNENFNNHTYLDYAYKVENITLKKKENLILNVDGFIAVSLIDAFIESKQFSQNEIEDIVNNGIFNGFFVLARTIGLIGHWNDQNRLNQDLYRNNDVCYL